MQTKTLSREVGMYCYANQNMSDGTKLRARASNEIGRFASYPSKDSSDAIRRLFEERSGHVCPD
jgi:hypothetical protein